ncbi:MAG: hypothetical protein BGN96_14655 [Bacteroidales bacterium 45-6]|nr:MAG: hypothetical protein BGN96_14655 [Bacteroidales bacterium 45-6]
MELEKFKSEVVSIRGKLHNQARNMLANEDDAEDAVQETYLKLWNVRSQLAQHPNVAGFAMQTLKNVCIDRLRAERIHVRLDDASIAVNSTTPYTYTEQNDSATIIRQIIDSLPETQRQIMLMRDIHEYELEEIAEITGSNPTAVRVNLSRARKAVRDKFININQRKQ